MSSSIENCWRSEHFHDNMPVDIKESFTFAVLTGKQRVHVTEADLRLTLLHTK